MKPHPIETKTEQSISVAFKGILEASQGQSISFRQIFSVLKYRGYAVLFTVLSFPVSFPITLPGLCLPIGLLMALLGWRFALRKSIWCPEWILRKQMPYNWLKGLFDKVAIITNNLRKFLRPRLCLLVENPILQTLHGLIICLLSILLAIPVPLPAINTFAALPIFFFGLGYLKDDGLAIVIAYLLTLLGVSVFVWIFYMGELGLVWFSQYFS